MLVKFLARRNFSTSTIWNLAAQAQKSTSPLAALRKKTGYSLTLCKKALETNDQDLNKAEQWLNDQALAQGWDKANKLQFRNATQGLIGVYLQGKSGCLVEMNCETDFVARNEKFHHLLAKISKAASKLAPKIEANESTTWKNISGEELSKIEADGMPVADLVALEIGQIGENIVLKRGVTVSVPDSVKLAGLTHPTLFKGNHTNLGRFGTILTYSKNEEDSLHDADRTEESLTQQFCQHIIGMNPKSIGDMSTLKQPLKPNEKEEESNDNNLKAESVERNEEGDEIDPEVAAIDKKEDKENSELIHQEFLLDNEKTFGQVLQETGFRVHDFIRLEVGREP